MVANLDVLDFDGQFSPVGHGVSRIHRQVGNHLLHLPGVCLDAAEAGRQDNGQVDVLADQAPEHALHPGNQRVEIHHLGLQDLLAAEGEQLAGQRSRSLSGPANFLQVLMQRVVVCHLRQCEFSRSVDDGEEIVEVVRDAAGELANRLHLLRLLELTFKRLPRGDVDGDAEQTGRRSVRLVRHLRAAMDPVGTGVRPDDPKLHRVVTLAADRSTDRCLHVAPIIGMNQLEEFLGGLRRLVRREAVQGRHGGGPRQLVRRELNLPHPHPCRAEREIRALPAFAQRLLTMEEGSFRLLALAPCLRLLKGSMHRRHKPVQVTLQQVVGRADLQASDRLFFADRAGKDDHRRLGPLLLCPFQCSDPVVAGQVVVGDDEIERLARQRCLETVLTGCLDDLAGQTLRFQLVVDQLRIMRVVFQMEHSDRICHVPVYLSCSDLSAAAETARRGFVDDSPERAEMFDGFDEFLELDRLDHVGIDAQFVAAK